MKNLKLVVGLINISLIAIVLASCSDMEEERQEVINKFRAIGVITTPSIDFYETESITAQRSKSFEFLSLIPKDAENPTNETLTLDAEESPFPQVPIQVSEASTVTELGPLKLVSQKATGSYVLPEAFSSILQKSTFFTLPYGLTFKSGAEEEKIVGKLVLMNATLNAEVKNWQAPTLTISEPAANATLDGTEITLKANIETTGFEKYKVAWFTSAGKIINRRSLETKWKEIPSGQQTLVVTIRGRTTGSFAYQAITVTAP